MPRSLCIAALALAIAAPAGVAFGQAGTSSTPARGGSAQTIDGVAVRIDTDLIAESEVRELSAFQKFVDGAAKPREEVIRELIDQWTLRGEAETARYPHPSEADVDAAYRHLVSQFPSPEEFDKRCATAGLTEAAVRRQLEAQLYLSRFIDFRFRPAAEVDDAAIQKYYDEEFTPQLKARNENVPALSAVQDTIREVLVQRAITERANQWLADTRSHLEVDVLPQRGGA